jgi:malate dehydrogenase (oxaloacetate-decarboxylating)(NADP+)
MIKVLGDGVSIGPLLVGAAKTAHIVTPAITVQGLLNMTALAAARG